MRPDRNFSLLIDGLAGKTIAPVWLKIVGRILYRRPAPDPTKLNVLVTLGKKLDLTPAGRYKDKRAL